MALVNSAFTVNVTPGAMPPVVHVSEYDIGRTYTVTINGQNGSAFNIPTGTTATVEGTLNGSVGFTQSATISNNQVSFALSESMTAYSGKAWCKIKLTLNNEPIQTCAFILDVDRAGVEAETVIGADGFEQQIVDAVNDWLDEHPPATGGMTESFKQALLDCFENVAWINDQGQTYYDALYAALYPPVDVLSISAVFTQGSAVIYDTDDLDTLKQYLVVTATMTDSTTQTVTDYTLSGTLTAGTSTITVSYSGKTTTFVVTVTGIIPAEYQRVEYIGSNGTQHILLNNVVGNFKTDGWEVTMVVQDNGQSANTAGGMFAHSGNSGYWFGLWGDVYTQNGASVATPTEGSASWNSSGMTTVTSSKTHSVNYSGSAPTHKNICLFGVPSANGLSAQYYASAKLYSMSIRKGGNAFMNLIPCYRKSDSVIGLYDTVNGIFHTNDGTGTFTKGADV